METKEYFFYLDIYYHALQEHYSGQASNILVNTTDGSRIQFPASYLRQYLTPIGIKGHFKITLDDKNDIVSLDQVS